VTKNWKKLQKKPPILRENSQLFKAGFHSFFHFHFTPTINMINLKKRPVGMLLDDFGKRVILESILPDPFRFHQFNLRVLEERCGGNLLCG
jgi:hypothetical protein